MTTSHRFAALFSAHYRDLARYGQRRGLSPADADDMTANVFVVAWRRIDEVPLGDEALLWLYGVAFNELRNFRRAARRRSRLIARLSNVPVTSMPVNPAEFSLQAIRGALERLSSSDQEVVLLASGEGLSTAQIGAVLGCSDVAARSRLHRARTRLAEQLGAAELVQHRQRAGHEVHAWSETKEIPDDQ